MENMKELNLNEMAEVAGGKNEKGWEYIPKNIPANCEVYQIRKGDTMSKIAQSRNTTTARLLQLNPKITNPRLIRTGDYLYIKK